jgi:transcriptional regulator with XRE-family HTH domain
MSTTATSARTPKKARRLRRSLRTPNEVARKIYDLGTKAGLTQKRLAKLAGTAASVISPLEGADYDGHSLAMLRRIARAFDKRVEIRFVSM